VIPLTTPLQNQNQTTTAAKPASQYTGQGNAYNEILYLKNLYENPNSTSGQKQWASSQAQQYYGQLNEADRNTIQNMNATSMKTWLDGQKQNEQVRNDYLYSPQVDPNQYRTQEATIEDIAKKYGFDYSRDYAKRQAELIKQQKSDDIGVAKKKVDNYLMDQAEALDRNYFQQYMQQAQNQVNSGLNAGIAADQDLRMAMARQAEMSGAYRDANAQHMDYDQQLARLGAEALVYEDQLYNDRLQQGFQNAMQLTGLRQSENLALLDAALSQRGQNIGLGQYLNNFNYQQGRDQISDQRYAQEWEQQLEQYEWQKLLDEAGLTGMYNGSPTFDRYSWQQEFDWQKYMDQQNLALARSRAFSPGGGTTGGTTSTNGSPAGALGDAYNQYKQATKAAQQSPADRYYQDLENAFKGSVVRKQPAYVPSSLALSTNPQLSNLDKVRMIRNSYY
jgi:hypothetical protein